MLSMQLIAHNYGITHWNAVSEEIHPPSLGGLVYLGNEDENFYALNGSTGGTMWKAHIGSALSSPAFTNNKLFVGTTTGMIFAANATDGQILWNCSARAHCKDEKDLQARRVIEESSKYQPK
jgi:outer membrane protein assembly factor BamB